MRLRRMLAFVLTLAMLMGNVTPAFAADSFVANSVSGNVTITADENGNTVITGNSDENSEVLPASDEDGGTEDSDKGDSDEASGEDGSAENDPDSSGENSSEDGTKEAGDGSSGSGTDGTENGASENGTDGSTEKETDEAGNDSSVSGNGNAGEDSAENGTDETEEDSAADETVSDNETDAEDVSAGDETEETVSDNDITVSDNELTVSDNDITVSENNAIKATGNTPLVDVINNDNDTSESFTSFQTAKEYVMGQVENDSVAEPEQYTLYLYDNAVVDSGALNYPDEVTSRIRLQLNGHTLTIEEDQNIRVDEIDAGKYVDNGQEEPVLETEGTLSVEAGKTLKFIPRSKDGNKHIWVGNLIVDAADGNIVIGDEEIAGSQADVSNVTAAVKNLSVYGNLYWDTGTVTVKEGLTVCNDGNNQEAGFGNSVTTGNFSLEEGSNMCVMDFESTGNTQVYGGNRFCVSAGGNAEFNNIEVLATEDEWESFCFALDQSVSLNSTDDAGKAYADYTNEEWDNVFTEGQEADTDKIFEGADMLSGMGTFIINGTVNTENAPNFPIRVQKMYCWDLPGDEDGQRACDAGFNIDEGEDFAVVNPDVSASIFSIDNENGCVRRYTDEGGTTRLQAAKKAVSVMAVTEYVDEDGDGFTEFPRGIMNDYATLENAIAGIAFDFDSFEGDYQFIFKDNVTLEEDVTIPDCVVDAWFMTDSYGTGEGELYKYIGDYQKTLDLNGHTLSTAASVRLHSGLRITSNAGTEEAPALGKLKFTTEQYVALDFNEDSTLVNENDEVIANTERMPVLTNVEVNAPDHSVLLYVTDYANDQEDAMQYMQNTSLYVKELSVSGGTWCLDKVTATYLFVNGFHSGWDEEAGQDVSFAKSALLANDITIQKYGTDEYGFMEVYGTVGTFETNEAGGKRPNLTLKDSKLFIADGEEKADCYLNTLTVETAYPKESKGDCTIENNGQFILNKLDMTGNGGKLVNRGNMVAAEISNVGDFQNEDSASLICDTFEQLAGSKTYLAHNSRLLINKKGTLNHVNLGDENGGGGDAILGKGSNALITINGSFTINEEEQKLEIAVTDSYAEISELKDEMTYFDPYAAYGENKNPKVTLLIPEADDRLFATDMEEFPVENIRVIPDVMLDENGDIVLENEQPVGNPLTAAYQDSKDGESIIRVTGETVLLCAVNADGMSENYLKSFTTWKDAVNYLTAIGNPNIRYVIYLNQEEADLGGTFHLPSNVARIEICGGLAAPVVLKNTGDITLETDMGFRNVTFETAPVIDTNGKALGFFDVRNITENGQGEEIVENVRIKTIRGTAASTVLLENSNIELVSEDAVSGIGQMEIIDSNLTTAGDVTVNTLLLKNMGTPSSLNADGKITIHDIITSGRGNGLSYDELVINGNIKSFTEDGQNEYSNVYAIPETQTAVIGEGTEVTADYYVISEEKPEDTEYVEVKRNAISLTFNDGRAVTAETKLATTPNIAASWFVYNRSVDETGAEKIENVTRKEGSVIKYGAKGDMELNAVLSVVLNTEEAEVWEIGSYATLQDAFDEIERINDSEQIYKIVLKADDSSAAGYKFPSKANGVYIQGAGGSKKKISFPSSADIKCNMDFENVSLVSGAEKGVLNINGFGVSLLVSDMTAPMTVTGSGIGKGSHFIVAGAEDGSTVVTANAIDKVDTLSVIAANFTVKDKTTAGKLWLGSEATLCGLGAIKLTEVECHGRNHIVTIPTKVKLEDGKITDMTSNLTISGSLQAYDKSATGGNETVKGVLNIKLGKVLENGSVDYFGGTDFSDKLMSSNKAVIAKAAKADTGKLMFNGVRDNKLYKKKDAVVYKNVDAAVELIYNTLDENGNYMEAATYCETFADAVAEINNLKTKRDYIIHFLPAGNNMATEFKMPNKKYVNTLMINSEGEEGNINDIYYLKDITLTSDVVLANANFVQVSAGKDANGKTIYTPIGEAAKAVKIKTGGNNLVFAGAEVNFNTPIALEGGNKGTLRIGESTRVVAGIEHASIPKYAVDRDSYILGTISKFAEVSVGQRVYLDGWTVNGKYTPAELNVTGFKIESGGDVTVGCDGTVNKARVQNLVLDGGNLYVYGTGEFKNVNLAGDEPFISVDGQKFAITGVLTSTAKGAEIVTTIDAKLQPVLDVSGTAVLEDAVHNRITVKVVNAEGNAVELGGNAGNNKTYSNHLLKAKKASETAFLADTACTKNGVAEYDAKTGKTGYFLKKNKDYVDVYYSENITAALHKNGTFINYYETLNDVLTVIKNYKDKTAEYKIELLKTVGSEQSPYPLAIPDKAAKVTFTAASEDVALYNGTKKNTQKTDVAFENITVVNTGTWETKGFDLEINSADVTVNGKAAVGNLILANGAVLRTKDVTTITDIQNLGMDGILNRIVCSKAAGLNIKGYVTDHGDAAKLILDAAGTADKLTKIDNKMNLSAAVKFAVLEKESTDSFRFDNGSDGEVTNYVAWTSQGIYITPENYKNNVQVQYEQESGTVEVNCLDLTEAANYINSRKNAGVSYRVILENSISDTKVTDDAVISPWILPNKDAADKVEVIGSEDSNMNIAFTDHLKVNGNVGLYHLNLANNGSFAISLEKNSDVKNGKEVIRGESSLVMENVVTDDLAEITGVKNVTDLEIVNSNLTLSGGVNNIVNFTVAGSAVETNAESKVEKLVLNGFGTWNVFAPTTIGNVALDIGQETAEVVTCIGTYYPDSNKVPQLTITGHVSGGKLPVRVYNFAAGEELTEISNYDDAKLALAKAESADKFIAYSNAEYDTEAGGYKMKASVSQAGIAAYKDKGGYVYNGNISSKEVILGQKESVDENGDEIWTESYAATYEEAIDIINSQGNKEAVYKITFVKGDVELETMLLPEENKAKYLTIDGNGHSLVYTGVMDATCNLIFENIALNEVEGNVSARGITLNTNVYHVSFGENVSTVYNSRTNDHGEYNLEFKTIKGEKGEVGFGNNKAYFYGEVNLGRVIVAGDAALYSEGSKVTISDIIYVNNGSKLSVSGEKAMTFTNVDALTEEITDATLDITTWYTNADTLSESRTQLNVKGEVDTDIAVNINPMVPQVGYDGEFEYVEPGPITEEQIRELLITSGVSPKAFQKVITAPEMMASDKVTLKDKEYRAVRYDGGIYFAEENVIEVTAYEDAAAEENESESIVPQEVFAASYLEWNLAVKEIDKMKRTDWSYDIVLQDDLGADTPLKSLSLPSKAKEIRICGTGDTGILTTGNKIAVKCPTEFVNITLCAVKQENDGYTSVPLTLDGGKFPMSLSDMQDGCDIEGMGWFGSELKLTGKKSTIDIFASENPYWNMISQISNAGNVTLHSAEGSEGSMHTHYNIKDGIQKVTQLNVLPDVELVSARSEVSVTNLNIGEPSGEQDENDENTNQKRNDSGSRLQAKNITVTGKTVMASADLKAGTTTVGDGKITLNNVVFRDNHNHIEGKQAQNGNSLISIKGSTSTKDWNPGSSAATISLCLNNSAKRYAQLAEGMTLLAAPKAITSLFRPNYDWEDTSTGEYYQNMGPEITEIIRWADENGDPIVDENGDPIVDESGNPREDIIYTYGLYKSGNDIKYGKIRDVYDKEVFERNEVRLWIGTSNPDEAGWNVPSVEYASFEEAAAAINSMLLYKEGSKVFEEYTIELLNDVEIGNEKGDGKYKALTLPGKTSGLNIRGNGHQIKLSGNLKLKCNTILDNVYFVPMKSVKGGAQPTVMNVAAGNYTLTIRWADFGYWTGEVYESEWVNCLNNITGSAKGRLVISEDTALNVNSISGLAVEFAGNGREIERDEDGFPRHMGALRVYGNLTTKELKYADYAAASLIVGGKLTVDAIYVEGETFPVIEVEEGNPIQIKGTTRTLEDKTKVTGSVFFDEVVKNGGTQPETEVTDNLVLGIWSATGPYVPDGTKVITGKYLNPDDWRVESFWEDGNIERTCYRNGNDLYLGSAVQEAAETP